MLQPSALCDCAATGAQSGEIQVQINTPRVDHQLKIALYDDQTTSWSEVQLPTDRCYPIRRGYARQVYHAQDSCANKLTHARSVFDGTQQCYSA